MYTSIGITLELALGQPDRPIRGILNDWTDRVLVVSSVVATLALFAYVVVATVACSRQVRCVSGRGPRPRPAMPTEEWADALGFPRSPAGPEATTALNNVLGVKLIASLTKSVGPLIYYPAGALVLMLFARSRALDNWDWPASLVIIFGVGGLAVVACGASLRLAAGRARRRALDELEKALHSARRMALYADDGPLTKAIRSTIKEVKSVREGAYCSPVEDPVIRAVLIPAAGLAGLIPLLGQLGINVGP